MWVVVEGGWWVVVVGGDDFSVSPTSENSY